MDASAVGWLRVLRIALAALTGAASLAGCGHKASDASSVAPKLAEKVSVEVINHHYLDVAIYALCEGQRTRIGVVGGSTSTTIELPSRLLGAGHDLRLAGDAIGSDERTVTELLIVQPGQFIQLLLESRLSRSSVGVY